MTEEEFCAWLTEQVDDNQWDVEDEETPSCNMIRTFDQVGMLTRNKGLVVSMADGSSFQVTVVKAS